MSAKNQPLNRRMFMGAGALAGAAFTMQAPSEAQALPTGTVAVRLEGRMAFNPATKYRPYRSKPARTANSATWIQFDLGEAAKLEAIRFYPAFEVGNDKNRSSGFPTRLKVEASNVAGFGAPQVLLDDANLELPDPADRMMFVVLPTIAAPARFVRITATELRHMGGAEFGLALSKVELLAGGKDVAEGRPVTVDAEYGNPKDLRQLTRKPRPQGEGIVNNNPSNVTPASQWKPAAYKAQTPVGGISLQEGLFNQTMENNIGYLLSSFSVDEMLRPFWERAGRPVPAGLRKPHHFWDVDLAGSTAGRFLMGAGNTLRWREHAELRQWMNRIVDGIADCRQPNGFIMAYPEDKMFVSERAGYTRAWVTHGLIEAGKAGNSKAFDLLRSHYEWYDTCPSLPELLRGSTQGVQGMVASTRMYFTPVGKPLDIQVVQQYFQENYWLEGLARREEDMVWQYPYDRPHNYLITDFEAYLDLYRATGEKRYLDAVLGAWQLYHDSWEHVGGSIAITEFGEFPPKSYRLKPQFDFCETGELCGSSFWAFLNQRLHLLEPDQEKYVAEIEKSIYNVGIANQVDTRGLMYHARLVGQKGDVAVGFCDNSCCEGQGTRLLGSLPEHIYCVVPDGPAAGLYVDLFAASTIRWSQDGDAMQLASKTNFPFSPDVQLTLTLARPQRSTISVRTPSWGAAEMPILVNGKVAVTGRPGSYAVLDRTWESGDSITFSLPMALKLTRYEGLDKIPGHDRYALEYGPILLAIRGSDDAHLSAKGSKPEDFGKQLKPVFGRPLHFEIAENPGHIYAPYFAIKNDLFTCYPVIDMA